MKKIKKDDLLDCVSKNMSQREISEHFSICREYVRNMFRHYGIPISNRRKKPFLDKELLIEENYHNNLTLKERSNRLNWQKKSLSKKLKLFDPNLSEQQNMELNGYNRIYDCGNKLYIWKSA